MIFPLFRRFVFFIGIPFLIFSFCINLNAQIPIGNWHAGLMLNDTMELPFVFTYDNKKITILNGEEKISVNEIQVEGDSVIIRMPVFDSEFHCKISDNNMKGFFYNHARTSKNRIPFHAENGLPYRFSDKPERTSFNITGRYFTVFDGEDEESKNPVGIFKQDGNKLSGTFLTTTGDYRYLDGEVNGNRMWLSAFDGSHLFLFTALIKGDTLYNGEFFSGMHWHDTWKGWRDEHAKLTPPDSLTFLRPGFDRLSFTYPDENKKNISLNDPKFKNKAVIVQIMGTWCPNCMDETKFLSNWYNNRKNKNVEIIALDYERIVDYDVASANIKRLKKRFNINYTILFAGSSDKKLAALTLPMLNHVLAFPTTLFLNSDKKVVKIHTGFNGPATKEEYQKFIVWFEKVVSKLK